MQPRFLFVRTYYPEFLRTFYAHHPETARQSYDEQLAALFDTGFGVGDAYSFELRRLGCAACEIICNADPLQERWAQERRLALPDNIHDRRRRIAAAQIAEFQPDVLYVFEWHPLGDAWLADMRRRVRLVVGQIASPLRTDRTYAAYDLMLSSFPPLVGCFRQRGVSAELFRLGFDERVLQRLGNVAPAYDVTFVGGLAPSHPDRLSWLEAVLREVPVDIFGYGWEAAPPDSPIRNRLRGEVWGWTMYRTLAASRITLNRHARIDAGSERAASFANNMRLFEATGVGACLITERKENLAALFEPGCEVVTYDTPAECAARVRYLLDHEEERKTIARAGQRRTLAEHTYRHRMTELLDIIRDYM